jgi:superfamily II DNA or RNA helicase
MNGKFAPQQRAIKMLEANKRMGLAFSAGSGKTPIMLGAYSHLHSKGKVKRSIMLVPSIVQGQFGGEALRYLQPGKFKWHAQPGASRAERIAAYKDPETNFVVQTHQSFRDDMLWLGAQHEGIEPSAMADKIGAMPEHERNAWMKGLMEKEGINFDASMVDEAHETLNRKGKDNSTLANVTDSLSSNTPYYVYASGDPAKNDASEVYDLLHKCDSKRYSDREAFLRKYGVNTLASKDDLKREMSRYVFSSTIRPDISAVRKTHDIELSGGQKKALSDLDSNFAKARHARMNGKVDLAALKQISPGTFEGVDPADEQEVGAKLQKSLGMIKNSSQRRIINDHPDNAKIDKTVEIAKANKGKQGVVFAHSRAAVAQTTKRLKAEGFNVVTVTGSDSSKDKDAKRKLFNPEGSGPPGADIMVASDAAAVGMNLQSGQYLIQHDTPDTAKNHGQRNARIDRIGQKNDVELHDLVANHPSEQVARRRLDRKYGLRNMMLSPIDSLDDSGIAGFLQKRATHKAAA